jgi:hypothetical protein
LLAQTLELDENLVENLAVNLKALNSKEDLDSEKIGIYAFKTFERFIKKYQWFKMPCTLHKILANGSDIIKISPLSPGIIREFLARKICRKKPTRMFFKDY